METWPVHNWPEKTWPVWRPVGDSALLIALGDTVDEATHARVVALDHALVTAPPSGLVEVVPAYASVLIHYDPLLTDSGALAASVLPLLASEGHDARRGTEHEIPVCYDGDMAPDLPEVGERLGLGSEEVIDRHLAGRYRVFMYGFAPGYAYLGGVPDPLHLPRKPRAVRGHPVGSVMIAGPQCLITTLEMPTGWWVIGRSPARILVPEASRPFRFEPGDRIRFRRIERAEFGLVLGLSPA